MKRQYILSIGLLVGSLLINMMPALAQSTQNKPQPDIEVETDEAPISKEPRFGCENHRGTYTVMYYPESQPRQSYAWATPANMGGGWSSFKRCEEISRRLEEYRPAGLVELRTGRLNNYDILCATTRRNPGCQIILTVPPGQDPIATRDRVFQNLTLADSGSQTQGVYTYQAQNQNLDLLNQVLGPIIGQGGISIPDPIITPRTTRPRRTTQGIYLPPFLDPADGGTASQLTPAFPRHRRN